MSHRSVPRPSPLVTLFHITPATNWPSIAASGIDPSFARSTWRVCWLCNARKRQWAVEHVRERHQVDEVMIIRVRVPRSWLNRNCPGLWTCPVVVEPRKVVSVSIPSQLFA